MGLPGKLRCASGDLSSPGVHAVFRDKARRTPLYIAAKHWQEAIARDPLENGALPGPKYIIGQCLLSYALENSHVKLVYLLNEKDPFVLPCRDMFGRSPPLLSTGIYDPDL